MELERRDPPIPPVQLAFRIIAIGGCVFVLGARIWLGHDLPLWLDETWTGMIASQADLRSFWHEVWLDINAPLYYQFMWLWTGVAGYSNFALRAPSMLFTIAAAAVPLWWKLDGLSRDARIAWASLIFLWWPATMLSLDARSYALLLLLSVLLAHAFIALLTRPTARRLNIWCALGALSIAVHYFSVIVVAAQGLALLWAQPRSTLRNWPAFVWFVPVLAWLAYHAPRLATYSRPEIAWYAPFDLQKAVGLVSYTVGPESAPFVVMLACLCALFVSPAVRSKAASEGVDNGLRPLLLGVLTGVLATAAILLIDAIRPTVTGRYLTVVTPLMLLGLVLMARMTRWPQLGFALLVALSLSASLSLDTIRDVLRGRASFGFEAEAEYLLRGHPRRVIFTWDSPGTRVLDPGSLRKLGEFFFFRAGQRPEVVPVIVAKGDRPESSLLRAAGQQPSAILWIYDHRTDTPYWTPAMQSRLDRRHCRNSVKTGFVLVACDSGSF